MLEFVGLFGAICLGVCALPQTAECIKTRSAGSLSWSFLLLWTIGELCLLAYTVPMKSMALTLNYSFNILLLAIMLWFKTKDALRRK